jgi:hypothetical protein
MGIFRRSKKPEKTRNIVVYYLSAIVDGNMKASPLGCVPRLPLDYEAHIRSEHSPREGAYINQQLHGFPVILFWTNDGIDAMAFLSLDQAKKFPGLIEFGPDDLTVFDHGLAHFPR